MAGWISILSMMTGAVGIFFGFYYLSTSLQTALAVVTVTTVGIVGLLAFLRHVIFHRSDAKRLGWETDRPDWMFEVGFANLAFSFMAFIVVFATVGVKAQAVILLGYALYLLQAAVLHGFRYFTDAERSPSRLWRSVLATLLYVGMMSFFAFYALVNQ
ncbi:MAG: hypothetical protein PF439_09245 [Helicobacteraceae bacterium]|jgi:hypothetical protein|nr:hypothetical protein [Helicobacteraceae bacterium]